MKRILHVVGARPNFMKVAPIMREMSKYPYEFEQILVHTGQHYDASMSQVFFDELELPKPDVNLEVGSGSHAWQTGEIMQRFEPVLLDYKPDWVFVPGDVNSTVACALVASKLGVKVAHVEAGLRSFDRTMPEEINRVLTDHLADLLFTTEPSGNEHLSQEGISADKVCFVGNTMIDTLVRLLPKAEARWSGMQTRLNLERNYLLVTLHRPSNVDNTATLNEIMQTLVEISHHIQVVFPVHPRTRQRITTLDLFNQNPEIQHLIFLEPLGYLDFLALQSRATLVLTDSGGVQEETSYLGVPCMTIRPNTERPITLSQGTNRLFANFDKNLASEIRSLLNSERNVLSRPQRLELWDGEAASRIVRFLSSFVDIK